MAETRRQLCRRVTNGMPRNDYERHILCCVGRAAKALRHIVRAELMAENAWADAVNNAEPVDVCATHRANWRRLAVKKRAAETAYCDAIRTTTKYPGMHKAIVEVAVEYITAQLADELDDYCGWTAGVSDSDMSQ